MGTGFSSSTPFNFYDPVQGEAVFQGKYSFPAMEFLNQITSLPSENHLIKDQNHHHHHHHQDQSQPKFDNLMLEDFNFDTVLQPTHPFPGTTRLNNQKDEASKSPLLSSLELLNNYGSRFKRSMGQSISKQVNVVESHQKMSTEQIVRLAGERYVQFSTHWYDNICMPMHPYGFDLSGLSEEENRDVELVQFLLTAAHRIGCEQFERASRLVLHCQLNSSDCATPVQKVIFYFAQALGERIARETGMITTTSVNVSDKNEEYELVQKMDFKLLTTCHRKMPFNQVMLLASIQTILEQVASETKIHVIDLEIRCGVQWTALMQALAERHERPVQLLKITGVGLWSKTKLDTGKYLTRFAESLNLPFSYNSVFVSDMMEIREDHFDISNDEAVAVYCPYVLRTMIPRPESLENLMGIIRYMKPSIMILLEVEANHNSPSFVNRFTEALFFYSAYFDCVETCFKDEKECKAAFDEILCEGVRNIVAMEGKERTVRNVKIDVWRRFFARYKVVEIGFSESSLYQADLSVKQFAHGHFCSLDKNGKTLFVGWKGTPIHSLSAWKFL